MSVSAGASAGTAMSTVTAPDMNNSNAEELEETVSRLFSHPGVQAVFILNRSGDVLVERTSSSLRSSFAGPDEVSNNEASELGASSNHPPAQQQQQQHVLPKRLNHLLYSVRALLGALPDHPQRVDGGGTSSSDSVDDENLLGFLQIRSADGTREILVAPHRGYVLAVIKMPIAAS